MEWISVKTRLPHDTEFRIHNGWWHIAYWVDDYETNGWTDPEQGRRFLKDGDAEFREYPTHWAVLPPPPFGGRGMTGHELLSLLESLSAERLSQTLYLDVNGYAVTITRDNLIVQPAPYTSSHEPLTREG